MGRLLRRYASDVRRRISFICKWTLTLLLTLVLALEIASVWWTFTWQRRDGTDANQVRIAVERGKWEIFWHEKAPYESIGNPLAMIPRGLSVRHADDPGWGFRFGRPLPFIWTACEFTPRKYGWSWGIISFPLTYAILALAAPTGWLWLGELRRRKKARAGCCRSCGYDLRGLEGVKTDKEGRQRRCPECGKPAATA